MHQATTRTRRFTSRDLALIATFAAIMAALGTVPAFTPAGMPVPITAQSMGVMLAGAIIGRRRGGAAIMLFIALVALGLPLLAGGRGGLAVFSGPSVGYIVGYPLAAWVVGWLTEALGAPYRVVLGIVANVLGGIVVLYAIGIPATAWRAHISLLTALAGSGWFIVGDVAKAVVTAFVARGVHAAYPGLLPERRALTQPSKVATPVS